jgi:lipid-A-disaccharide synthase
MRGVIPIFSQLLPERLGALAITSNVAGHKLAVNSRIGGIGNAHGGVGVRVIPLQVFKRRRGGPHFSALTCTPQQKQIPPIPYTDSLGHPRILISAGEASGDLYASQLVEALRVYAPDAEFFGCAGPRMRKAGVRAVVESESLAVVGLAEVITHIPRIYGEFRKLLRAADEERPQLAVLTDSPDFHLRLAKKLRKRAIPVVYLIAPQAWAWREHRTKAIQRDLNHLLCIFPFEEQFFRDRGVPTTFIGHPLSRIVKPELTKDEFFRKHRLRVERPLITVLPGSRRGEVARHLPAVLDAVDIIYRGQAANFVWAAPAGFGTSNVARNFRSRIERSPIQLIEGETWDAMAHADVALAASGTVTMEAAILGTPMVTFYKVTQLSWRVGRPFVRAPFFCMVNLVAGKLVVPELMQNEVRGDLLASAVMGLLNNPGESERMRRDLTEVVAKLQTGGDPIATAAKLIWEEYLVNAR